MDHRLEGVCALPHLGVIAAVGEEAARFLHNQLTQDFVLMGEHEARLAAFCTAKGRMLASFIGVKRSPTEVLLVTSADLLAPTLKRLSMFVLRAKVKLSDATPQVQLFGLAGQAAAAALGDVAQPWGVRRDESACVVRLYPADGVPRALWIAQAGTAPPAGDPMSPDAWLWSEVRGGIATVTAPVSEAFVPQMLNYESVGGVNFKKGCYPGQEVVARSQFRGTLKRRAALGHVAADAAAGQEVFHSADPTQPCGLVVQSAPAAGGGTDVIVSLQVSATEGGSLAVGAADGASLSLLTLPYPLLADI